MVNALIMAKLDGTQDLHEDLSRLCVVLDVVAFLGDLGEQVAFRAVLENNESAIPVVNDLVHGNNAVVLAGKVVKLDLALLELPLSWVESGFVQGLDGIQSTGHHIAGLVDSSISTNAKNVDQLDVATENRSNPAV